MELQEYAPELPVRTDLLVRIGQILIGAGDTKPGLAALRRALLQGGTGLDPSTALNIARAARDTDTALASAAARIALCHPEIQAAERRQALALTEVHQP
jgi:hypothetical protein